MSGECYKFNTEVNACDVFKFALQSCSFSSLAIFSVTGLRGSMVSDVGQWLFFARFTV